MVSSATTVNSLVDSRSDDRHRLPLRGRSSHPEELDGYLLCTSSSRKFDKSVLAMTSQNESNKEKKETVGTKVGPRQRHLWEAGEQERLQTHESFHSQPEAFRESGVVLVRAAYMYVCIYVLYS